MIKIDGSLIIQLINFLILIWALNYVLYRPIRGILAQRREKVNGLANGIERFEQDAGDKAAAFESGIKQAREEGLKVKSALEEEGREEEKRQVEKINEKARQDMAEIREKVARETEEVRIALQSQIDTFVDEISQKILGRAV